MKRLMKIASVVMIGLFTFVPFLNVEAKTEWTAEDWTDGGDFGTATVINDNVTKMEGTEVPVGTSKTFQGPYSKSSKDTLEDGIITEEVYIELNKADAVHGELFELSMSLDDVDHQYVTELRSTTQKVEDNYVVTVALDPDFKATIEEDGVYTYRYTATVEDGKTYLEFTILKWDEVIGTTKIDMGETTVDSVRSMWFNTIQRQNGVNVYTTLPEKPVDPEVPVNPVDPETPTDEVKNEENPETSDGIVLFLGLTVVGFVGTALTYRRLHN